MNGSGRSIEAEEVAMKIQVLGTGCARCQNLYDNTVEAVGRLGADASAVSVEKVVDPEVFFSLKVFVTPALVIDDQVISSGKVMTADQIEAEVLKRRSGE
jgi:small redox-active disulfide protein 2